MKLSRKLAALCLAAALTAGMAVTAFADSAPVKVTVNGQTASTTAYINSDWRTMVPAEVADAMGVTYSVEGNSVTFTANGITQTYTAGAAAGDTVAEERDGTLYVPFYHLAQTFGFQASWDSAAGGAAAVGTSPSSTADLTMADVTDIQAYTDETIYGTGVVEVVVNYKDGTDLSGVSASSYILEDRGSLSPDFGRINIANASVSGNTVTLIMSGDTQATADNKTIYTGDNAEGSRVRNALGIYCTGAWYRDAVDHKIHYGSEDNADKGWVANDTKQGYQTRACLELKLRHANEPASAAACLADDNGQYNAGGLWKATVDRQFGEGKFQSFADMGIQVASTAASATDGTGDAYVRGYAYVPANYNPANGIVFTLQGQGISFWQLPDGTNDDGTGIRYDSATTSWANTGAIVVNIHDRSSTSKGGYWDAYDFVKDDADVMKYFIETYQITGPVVLQGNSRGTMASAMVIKALAGCSYNPKNQERNAEYEETYQLNKTDYPFCINSYICQNGTFAYQWDDEDYAAVAATDLRVWAFDGEQDSNNIDSITAYTKLMTEKLGADWAKENIRLTGYASELYAYWGESDHSTTRINGWYFDDAAYYGPDLKIVDGKIVYNTKLSDGDTYTLQARGSGSAKAGYEYVIYDELFHNWALSH